ncbi:MAG: hypothetical protein R6U96_04780 [Promethearchaeia archaeon]
MISQEIAREQLLTIVREINIHQLTTDVNLLTNPYSIIHPWYLLYIWGKLEGSDDILKKARPKLNKLIQEQIDSHEYIIAGEFLILKLKIEGHLKEKSGLFFKTYQQSIKLFKNLSVIEDNPYNLEGIIEIKILGAKYGEIEINQKEMNRLLRKVANIYRKQAEKITESQLRDLKLIKFFRAISYLDKIKSNSLKHEKKIKEIIANKIITVALTILNELKEDTKEKIQFTDKKHILSLYYHMGRAYRILKKKEQSRIFLSKSIRALNNLLNDPLFEEKLFENKKLLHRNQGNYRVLNVRLFSENTFKRVSELLEKIDLLEMKERMINELDELNLDGIESHQKPHEVQDKIVKYYQRLIDIFKTKLDEDLTTELIKHKYRALCLFFYYKIYKILKKRDNG